MDDLTQVLQSPTALMLAAGLAVIVFLFGKLIVDSLIDSTDFNYFSSTTRLSFLEPPSLPQHHSS
jgi:hypothetical protein